MQVLYKFLILYLLLHYEFLILVEIIDGGGGRFGSQDLAHSLFSATPFSTMLRNWRSPDSLPLCFILATCLSFHIPSLSFVVQWDFWRVSCL